jgi:hypothetical protein|tara:strand:- start:3394 stop:4266 length:873 start_codon:yes stop_codon:yes gene_type:complete
MNEAITSEEAATEHDEAERAVNIEPDSQGEVEQAEASWRDSLPDELKGVKTLEKFKDTDALAKGYVHLEKYFDGTIKIPGENATQEEVDKYYSKLGRPDTIEGYEYEKAEMPEGQAYDETFEKAFLTKAHAEGLNNKQVSSLYEWWNGQSKDIHVQNTVAKENSIQKAEIELRADWGRQYDEKISGVGRLVDQYASGEDRQYLIDSGIGNDPHLARMLDRIAKDHGEAKHLGDPKINAFTDPASAQQAKDAFYKDTESDDYKAYFNENHPRHKEVGQMLERWNKTIYGDE